MPIHSSNAMIYNSKTKKPDRVGVLKLKDNKKVRVYKSTGEQIDLWVADFKKYIKKK